MGLYKRPLILAHRCLYPGYPENTLLSLEKAIENGCDYVEIDCVFTKDHRIINIHSDIYVDEEKKKVPAENLSFDYIRNIDLGMNQKIPLIEEVFEIIKKSNINIDLDIKNEEVLDYEEYPENNIPELILKYGLEKRANINLSMFAPIEYINENKRYRDANFRFTYNAFDFSEDLIKDIKKWGFFGVDFHDDRLTVDNIKFMHKYGLEVHCYPVNEREKMERLIDADIDVIETDRMDILKEVLVNRDLF